MTFGAILRNVAWPSACVCVCICMCLSVCASMCRSVLAQRTTQAQPTCNYAAQFRCCWSFSSFRHRYLLYVFYVVIAAKIFDISIIQLGLSSNTPAASFLTFPPPLQRDETNKETNASLSTAYIHLCRHLCARARLRKLITPSVKHSFLNLATSRPFNYAD